MASPLLLLLLLPGQSQQCDSQMRDEMATMTERLSRMEEREAKMEVKLSEAMARESPPQLAVCAHRSSWFLAGATVTYDSLLSDHSSSGPGTLDPATGVFTAPVSGHYTVAFSAYATLSPKQRAYLYIYWNKERVRESEWLQDPDDSNGDLVSGQGARILVREGQTTKLMLSAGTDATICYRSCPCQLGIP